MAFLVGKVPSPHDLDLATTTLYNAVLSKPANAAFAERVLSNTNNGGEKFSLKAGIVPGAFYREHKKTGADGEKVAGVLRKLGCTSEVIQTESFGGIETNASIIRHWLEKNPGEKILVSLCKGSLEVKATMNLPGATPLFKDLRAWFNVSGILTGTPLVNWFEARPLRMAALRLIFWWRKYQFSPFHEISPSSKWCMAGWPEFTRELPIAHFYGFPLREHLTHPWSKRAHDRLSHLGPNDGGGILLKDTLDLPGLVLPLWGVDHYMSPVWNLNPILESAFAELLLRGTAGSNSPTATPRLPPASKSSA